MTNAQGSTINWDKAIARNRDALLRIVEVLFAMAGLAEGEIAATLPRHLRNHILRILRPAEAAVRRLVIIAARPPCCGCETASAHHHNTIHHNNHKQSRRRPGAPPHRSAEAFRFPAPETPREILPAHQRDRGFRATPDPRGLVPLARRRARRRADRPPAAHAETRAGRSRRSREAFRPLESEARSRPQPLAPLQSHAPGPAAGLSQAGLSRGRRRFLRECHALAHDAQRLDTS